MGEGKEKNFDEDLGVEPNHMNVDSIVVKHYFILIHSGYPSIVFMHAWDISLLALTRYC